MSFLNNVWSFGGIHIFAYFAIMSIIVFVHELGHFLVGRWCGVKIEAFSLGLGPELFGFDDRYGTHWRVAAFPLGGYVKFHGDANGASVPDNEAMNAMPETEKAVTLGGQKVWKRAAIVAAGPMANFILAIGVFTGLFYFEGLPEPLPRVGKIIEQSAAEAAGFKSGDLVLEIDGKSISVWPQLANTIVAAGNLPMVFVVERDGARIALNATPKVMVDNGVRRVMLGIAFRNAPQDVTYTQVNLPQAVQLGVTETWSIIVQTASRLRDMVMGRVSLKEVKGPPGIAEVLGDIAKTAPELLIRVLAILSLSIGLFNLLPIPLLDGGHLMFYAYEAIRGKPMDIRAQEVGFRIGMALVGCLLIFVVSNDSLNIIGRIMGH